MMWDDGPTAIDWPWQLGQMVENLNFVLSGMLFYHILSFLVSLFVELLAKVMFYPTFVCLSVC